MDRPCRGQRSVTLMLNEYWLIEATSGRIDRTTRFAWTGSAPVNVRPPVIYCKSTAPLGGITRRDRRYGIWLNREIVKGLC